MPSIPTLVSWKQTKGFTLAELLISLAILGVIATFTIPKILSAQQNGSYRSTAKESIGAIAAAFTIYKLNNSITASTTGGVLTQYFNYLKMDTSGSTIDDIPGYSTLPCDASAPCLKMANGSVVQVSPYSFDGTSTTNAIRFKIDPDGIVTDGTTNGPGKSLSIRIYTNGLITSEDNMLPNTCDSAGCWGPSPGQDPSWFSW